VEANPGGPAPEGSSADMADFLVGLGCALHAYGTPTHRIEEALVEVARHHGLRGQFLVTPTSVQASFGSGRHRTHYLERVDSGELDLQKLTRLHELLQRAYQGAIDPVQARAEVDEIRSAPPAYPRPVLALGFAIASAAAARVFSGGPTEILVSGVAGLLVGVTLIWGTTVQRLRRLIVSLASFVGATVVGLFANEFELVRPISVIASLIVLLPGMMLTSAMQELALGHLVSGTARMTGAIITLLQLGLGVALGTRLVDALTSPLTSAGPAALPGWSAPVAIVFVALSCTILYLGRLRDFLTVLPMSFIAYFASRFGQLWLGPEVGAAIGALSLGICANAVSRKLDQPTAIAIIPALLLLVPGSLGFRSLQSLMADDVTAGIAAGFSTFMIAIAIVSGLLVANMLVVSRRLL
jgi:uncharacterized membrane protein YjjP (DUF1212 family)